MIIYLERLVVIGPTFHGTRRCSNRLISVVDLEYVPQETMSPKPSWARSDAPMCITHTVIFHFLIIIEVEVLSHQVQDSIPVLKKAIIGAKIKIEEALLFASFKELLSFTLIIYSQPSPIDCREGRIAENR